VTLDTRRKINRPGSLYVRPLRLFLLATEKGFVHAFEKKTAILPSTYFFAVGNYAAARALAVRIPTPPAAFQMRRVYADQFTARPKLYRGAGRGLDLDFSRRAPPKDSATAMSSRRHQTALNEAPNGPIHDGAIILPVVARLRMGKKIFPDKETLPWARQAGAGCVAGSALAGYSAEGGGFHFEESQKVAGNRVDHRESMDPGNSKGKLSRCIGCWSAATSPGFENVANGG